MSRFKGKPIQGLPGKLPAGEEILWQGKPGVLALDRYVFRARLVGVYFAALIIWRVGGSRAAGHSTLYALNSGVSSVLLAAAAIALFSLFSWLIFRTTTYTITGRRVVITYGMALPKSLNLPFSRIEAADLRLNANGTGDIALRVAPEARIAYLLLWPHVRSAKGGNQPVLRCLAEPEAVARTLADAIRASLKRGEHVVVNSLTASEAEADSEIAEAQAA